MGYIIIEKNYKTQIQNPTSTKKLQTLKTKANENKNNENQKLNLKDIHAICWK